jgi:hypothetical protein
MKTLFLSILLTAGLFGQTATTPVASSSVPTPAQVASTLAQVSAVTLPTYVAGGAAYNQLAGYNFWGSAVVPVSNNAGVYESTTADLFPVKAIVNGKTAYIFTTSVREGVHKVMSNNGKFMTLVGADAGYAFASAGTAPSTTATSGVSASITITAIWQVTPSFAVMAPIRALYMPTLGGWNPIAEIGFVWKPSVTH